nr:uncharacterized protein LOC127312291 isoform X1 [Lolium perenne]XP_051198792.1 uncharacterized protein LOC127312291 isoform X2 [Lolium perenne]
MLVYHPKQPQRSSAMLLGTPCSCIRLLCEFRAGITMPCGSAAASPAVFACLSDLLPRSNLRDCPAGTDREGDGGAAFPLDSWRGGRRARRPGCNAARPSSAGDVSLFWCGAPISVMDYVRSRKRKGSSSELDVARSIELLILEASLLGVYTGQLVIILWASFRAPFQKLKLIF